MLEFDLFDKVKASLTQPLLPVKGDKNTKTKTTVAEQTTWQQICLFKLRVTKTDTIDTPGTDLKRTNLARQRLRNSIRHSCIRSTRREGGLNDKRAHIPWQHKIKFQIEL